MRCRCAVAIRCATIALHIGVLALGAAQSVQAQRLPVVPPVEAPRRMPSLLGLQCPQEAMKQLDGLDLQLLCRPGVFTGKYAPGRINSQDPSPGFPRPAEGVALAFIEPSGPPPPPPIKVPDVVGQEIGVAQQLLAPFDVLITGPMAPQGVRVRSQRPVGGTLATPGSPVNVQTQLTVPELNGLDCEQTQERVHAHGLAGVQCEEHTPNVPGALRPGSVFHQLPSAGQGFDRPVQVIVHVVAAAIVPNVVGESLAIAMQRIEREGLRARSDAELDGREREVVKQQPDPGTPVKLGTEVALNTERIVIVPDVVNRACDEAKQEARRRDLRWKCEGLGAGRFTWAEPVVQSQSPAAGARARPGDLLIGRARPPWVEIGVGGTLFAALVVWRLIRGPKPPPPPPKLQLRGEADPHPDVSVRLRTAEEPALPALQVRGEAGSAHVFVRGLGDLDEHDT